MFLSLAVQGWPLCPSASQSLQIEAWAPHSRKQTLLTASQEAEGQVHSIPMGIADMETISSSQNHGPSWRDSRCWPIYRDTGASSLGQQRWRRYPGKDSRPSTKRHSFSLWKEQERSNTVDKGGKSISGHTRNITIQLPSIQAPAFGE